MKKKLLGMKFVVELRTYRANSLPIRTDSRRLESRRKERGLIKKRRRIKNLCMMRMVDTWMKKSSCKREVCKVEAGYGGLIIVRFSVGNVDVAGVRLREKLGIQI